MSILASLNVLGIYVFQRYRQFQSYGRPPVQSCPDKRVSTVCDLTTAIDMPISDVLAVIIDIQVTLTLTIKTFKVMRHSEKLEGKIANETEWNKLNLQEQCWAV